MATPVPATTEWVPLWDTKGSSGAPSSHRLTHEPGGSDPLTVDASPAIGSLRTLGTGANQATAGNDTRLTNSRTPIAHAATHYAGGSDQILGPLALTENSSINKDSPRLTFNDTSRPANSRKFQIGTYNNNLIIQSLNDAENASEGSIYMDRLGTTFFSGNLIVQAGSGNTIAINSATIADFTLNETTTGHFRLINWQNSFHVYDVGGTKIRVDHSGNLITSGYIFPGTLNTLVPQTSYYICIYPGYGVYLNTDVLTAGSVRTAGYVYPGLADSPGNSQTSYYLAGHNTYGLYSNTGVYFVGSVISEQSIRATTYVRATTNYFEKARADANGIWRDFVPTLTGGVGLPSYNACKMCSIGGNTAVVQFHGVLTVPASGMTNFQFIWNFPIYATASAASTPMVRHGGTGMCLTLYGYNCVWLYYDGVGTPWPGGTYNISFTHTFEYYGS